jgi:hypothetical protein
MFFLFATFCWSNASLFCYIVLQYIGCFLCFFLYFLFSLCCWVGVVNICILSSLLSIIRRSWSSYSPILASCCFFLLYFVELCISYGVFVCCISLKCACLAMIFFFVECIIVLLLCDAIHYSCDAMTSLIFYFKNFKNVSLLLWVVVLLIVVSFFFFLWIWVGDILKFSLDNYNLVLSLNLCEDGQHVFIESSIVVPLNGSFFICFILKFFLFPDLLLNVS